MHSALLEEIGLTSRHLFLPTVELHGVYKVFNKFVKGTAVSGEWRELLWKGDRWRLFHVFGCTM